MTNELANWTCGSAARPSSPTSLDAPSLGVVYQVDLDLERILVRDLTGYD